MPRDPGWLPGWFVAAKLARTAFPPEQRDGGPDSFQSASSPSRPAPGLA